MKDYRSIYEVAFRCAELLNISFPRMMILSPEEYKYCAPVSADRSSVALCNAEANAVLLTDDKEEILIGEIGHEFRHLWQYAHAKELDFDYVNSDKAEIDAEAFAAIFYCKEKGYTIEQVVTVLNNKSPHEKKVVKRITEIEGEFR